MQGHEHRTGYFAPLVAVPIITGILLGWSVQGFVFDAAEPIGKSTAQVQQETQHQPQAQQEREQRTTMGL